MDTKFQTSFIPKKSLNAPITSPHRASVSIFMTLSVVIFLASLAYAGFAVWWNYSLAQSQLQYKKDLEKSRNAFNPELIETLRKANVKIDLAKQLLQNHLANSEVFDILSRLTIQSVRFNSFEFSTPASSKDGAKITLRGVGSSFHSIAFQSDVFGQSAKYGKNKILKNPVVSDLVLDQNGNVAFTFSATLNPTDLSYAKILQSGSAANSSDSSSNSSATSSP